MVSNSAAGAIAILLIIFIIVVIVVVTRKDKTKSVISTEIESERGIPVTSSGIVEALESYIDFSDEWKS